MATPELSDHDLERGVHRHWNSTTGSYGTEGAEGSLCFSDVEDGSTYSQFYSTTGDEHCFSCVSDTEIVGNSSCAASRRVSSASVVEIDDSVPEIKVHLAKVERDCRICHLSLDGSDGLNSSESGSGVPIELGCSCKDDLAVAHKSCAEAWFKIKGNKTCEICNSVACNVVGVRDSEQSAENNNTLAAVTESSASVATASEPRRFWQGHRFLNFLLACMVFAFVISWLFHFNVPS